MTGSRGKRRKEEWRNGKRRARNDKKIDCGRGRIWSNVHPGEGHVRTVFSGKRSGTDSAKGPQWKGKVRRKAKNEG